MYPSGTALATARVATVPPGAAAIVDDDLLAERLAHLVGDAARGGAGAAARGERDHQGDRARGVALRRGGRRAGSTPTTPSKANSVQPRTLASPTFLAAPFGSGGLRWRAKRAASAANL
jgi:hypothetical protein